MRTRTCRAEIRASPAASRMEGFRLWLLLLLMVSTASSFKRPLEVDVVDIDEEKDITQVNANHAGDDILEAPETHRSSITNRDELWTSPVPYVFHEGLELNAKGVILRAFDQFRLKTCIDFSPRDAEDFFIHVEKQGGCYSYIGQLSWTGGQTLSIGQYCDGISTVEHEFLHALGFFHEQSRPDRNEFISIAYENIISGRENNFRIAEDSSSQGVPYDYWSVMHYGKNAFTNGNGSTIVTKDPKYQDVIGQRQDMSPSDVEEINLLYKCNSSIAFKLYCDFSEEAMCQMTHCSRGSTMWRRVTRAEGGPSSDHTTLPSVTAEEAGPTGPSNGHFMHVSTVSGKSGDSAWLETPRVIPSRMGHLQCLQFYYFHNGSADDQLNVWIREFADVKDTTGIVRQMDQVTGPPTSHWRLRHVSLDPKREFQVEFEVQKGDESSSGGISIDDINLSEVQCPHVTLQVDDFEEVMSTSSYNTYIYSPRHYSVDGYAYRFAVEMKKHYFGLRVQLLSGEFDGGLVWPCLNRQMTFQAVDQNPHVQQHMSKQRSMTSGTDITTEDGTSVWDNPRKFDNQVEIDDGETVFAGPLVGIGFFWYLNDLKSQNFLKGGSAVFVFDFEDITPLITESTLPIPKLKPKIFKLPPQNPRTDLCSGRSLTTVHPTTDKRSTAHPTTHKRSTVHPMTNKRSTAHPLTDKRSTVHPMTNKRSTAHPLTDKRSTVHPMTNKRSTAHPTTDERRVQTIIHKTTDHSIFGFSPVMMSSPILILILSAILPWLA